LVAVEFRQNRRCSMTTPSPSRPAIPLHKMASILPQAAHNAQATPSHPKASSQLFQIADLDRCGC
jgi:hypothetical protein